MWCCHLLWDGGIFIVAYDNRVSLSTLYVFLCETWMISVPIPVPCPDSYFRPKSRNWSRAWPAFVTDSSGCKLPFILVALGFSTTSERYGRREEKRTGSPVRHPAEGCRGTAVPFSTQPMAGPSSECVDWWVLERDSCLWLVLRKSVFLILTKFRNKNKWNILFVSVTQGICSGLKKLFVPQYYLPAAHESQESY